MRDLLRLALLAVLIGVGTLTAPGCSPEVPDNFGRGTTERDKLHATPVDANQPATGGAAGTVEKAK